MTEEILRSARVEPTPHELDSALTAARKRAGAPVRHSNGGFMRSKIAIISILAMGFVTSGAGATLAIQGSSGAGNASSAEYPPPKPPAGKEETLSDTAGTTDPQTSRQASADDGKLPFTGFAAIPVILVGLGLLTMGVTLRRKTSRDDS